MSREDELKNTLLFLKRVIRSSPLSQSEVDRRIGVRPGYLSQVLIGRLDLKLKVLFRVLEAVGVSPGDFFEVVFANRAATVSGQELLRLLPRDCAQEVTPARLRSLVERALAEELRDTLSFRQGNSSDSRCPHGATGPGIEEDDW